jgi:hypothetical protein
MTIFEVLWFIDAAYALWRRRQGQYDKTTLACYYAAWRKRPSVANFLAYMRFRRDLGMIVPPRLIKRLVPTLSSQNARTQRAVCNWLWESNQREDIDRFPLVLLSKLADNSPPTAAALSQRKKTLNERQDALALLQNRQEQWRQAFLCYLKDNVGNICVVGNAATLLKRGIGNKIDSHAVVFRFNHYTTASHSSRARNQQTQNMRDIGKRLNVWVLAPNLRKPYSAGVEVAKWVILTGPDMRYQLADWNSIVPLLTTKKRVLTVPLKIWQTLVQELKAPPSAGVLCLAWIIDMLESPKGLVAAGFQRQGMKTPRYHYALLRHKGSRRHNWQEERALLDRWQAQGLQFLD